ETVLDRDGTGGVTVRAVAREAQVAPMGVYNRFANKDGLLAALAIRAFDGLAAAIDVPTDLTPVERLRRACRGYRDHALAHPARYSLIFSAGTPAAEPSSPVMVRGHEVFLVLVGMVGDVIGSATREPLEAGQAVWNAVHGAVTIELAGIGQTSSAADSYEHMLDLIVDGLRSQSPA
ncbi:MAG: TetR/AcrR family transcriptional regulator, partial [Mycobacterium sp.]